MTYYDRIDVSEGIQDKPIKRVQDKQIQRGRYFSLLAFFQ